MFHVKQPFIYLTLPGWLNSGPDHWQSHWEEAFGDQRVDQADWDQPLRGDWQIALQEHLLAKLEVAKVQNQPEPKFVFIAHSLGCHLVCAWAKHSPLVRHVQAALLVAPPDLSLRSQVPPALRSWSPPLMQALPFASYLVFSSDDPYASSESSQDMALAWGCARCIDMGACGHLNAASELGYWEQGRQWLDELVLGTPHTQGVV